MVPQRNSIEWKHCFICSSPRSVGGTRRRSNSKQESSINSSDSIIASVKSELTSNERLLLKYLLGDGASGDTIYKDILGLVGIEISGGEGGGDDKLIGFCDPCEQLGKKVTEMQMELEGIRRRIVEKVNTTRKAVIESSRLFGSNLVIQESYQRLEGVLRRKGNGKVDKAAKVRGKKFLEVLHDFQTFVFDNDKVELRFSLVYLDKLATTETEIDKASNVLTSATDSDCMPQIKIENDVNQAEAYEEDYFDASFAAQLDNDLDVDMYKPEPEVARLRKISSGESAICENDIEAKQIKIVEVTKRSRKRSGEVGTSEKKYVEENVITNKTDTNGLKKMKRGARGPYKKTPKLTELQQLATKLRSKKAREKRIVNRKFNYSCEYCAFNAKFYSRMVQHLSSEHETPEKKHTCPQCKSEFTTSQNYELHVTHLCGSFTWKCDMCLERINRKDMKEHVRTSHQGELNDCEYCELSFASLSNLVAHYRYHKTEKLCCKQCLHSEPYMKKRDFFNHMYEVHGHTELALQCDVPDCSKIFFTNSAFIAHKNIHLKRFFCELCQKPFASQSHLDTHYKVCHLNEKCFECDICTEKYSSKVQLQKHKMKSHNAPTLKCNICPDKEFWDPTNLSYHLKTCHPTGNTKIHCCDQCGKTFPFAKDLRRHEVIHSDRKEIFCEECGFATKTREGLRAHRVVRHSDIKKFACDFCPKTFAVAKYLKDHRRIHTLEKPYKCDICQSAFSQQGSLILHRRKHAPIARPPPASAEKVGYVTGNHFLLLPKPETVETK